PPREGRRCSRRQSPRGILREGACAGIGAREGRAHALRGVRRTTRSSRWRRRRPILGEEFGGKLVPEGGQPEPGPRQRAVEISRLGHSRERVLTEERAQL